MITLDGHPGICSIVDNPSRLREVEALIASEWEEVDELLQAGIPAPLFALKNNQVTGCLSFTLHASPSGKEQALWINTVVVKPERRRQGIASELLQAAVHEAGKAGHRILYAHTSLPGLYISNGWKTVGEAVSETGHFVMVRHLPPCDHQSPAESHY